MNQYRVAKWSSFLATRERGRRVREEIEDLLRTLTPGETLAIDFADVEGITVSFGDESVAKLVLARETGDFADRGMVIRNVNEDVRETLDTVLARRRVAVFTINASGEPEILGVREWLPATLVAALALRTFRAIDLAAKLGLTPQATNNRLRLLVASGAVARERVTPEGGGKEFSYKTAALASA